MLPERQRAPDHRGDARDRLDVHFIIYVTYVTEADGHETDERRHGVRRNDFIAIVTAYPACAFERCMSLGRY